MKLGIIIIALALSAVLVESSFVGGRERGYKLNSEEQGDGSQQPNGDGSQQPNGDGSQKPKGDGSPKPNGGGSNPPARCLECAHNVNEVIDGLKGELAKDEPIPFKGIDPCNECHFLGGSTMSGQNDACVKRKGDGLKQRFTVKFAHITIICNCTLPGGLSKFIKIADGAGRALKTMMCDLKDNDDHNNDQKDNDDDDDEKTQNDFIPRNPSEFPTCIPKVSAVTSAILPSSNASELATATAGATWADVEARVVIIRRKNKAPSLKKIGIVNKNFERILTHCTTLDPDVTRTCQCCGDSDFMKSILIKAAEALIPCLLNSKEERLKSVVRELQCETDSLGK